MTKKSLSQQICEVCGIEPTIIEDYDSNEYEVYPDFKNNNNKLKLIDLLIENDHIITISNGLYLISNGNINFAEGCFNVQSYVRGGNLLESLYNYITIPISISYIKQGFNGYLQDIEKIKQAIREATWEI